MNKRRIIIPAAGEAVRFGGIPKELLPISETDCSLTRAVCLAKTMGQPVVITNPIKEPFHRRALLRAGCSSGSGVEMLMQPPEAVELWGAIRCGLLSGVAGGLILADTVAQGFFGPQWHKVVVGDEPLMFGAFTTREPERFSVVTPDGIATKQKDAPSDQAWGMVFWSAAVTDFLLDLAVGHPEIEHYDRAFEAAMKQFKWGMFPLAYYHDLGTFKAYRDFLNSPPHPDPLPQVGEGETK